jgi:hypothetical protein
MQAVAEKGFFQIGILRKINFLLELNFITELFSKQTIHSACHW